MVNVCMTTFNRLEFTRQAIESLATAGMPYVLTVVDNGSADGTPEYLAQLKMQGIVKNLILLPENIGVAKAQNLAWAMEPDARYYLKYDNDIVMKKPGWLKAMAEVAEKLPELGVAAYSFEPRTYPLKDIRGVRVRPKDASLGGACFLVPKNTERMLGYWCEDYGFYGEEDADYCWRVRLSGSVCAYMEDEDAGIHLPAGKAAVISRRTAQATDGLEETTQAHYRLWKDQQRRKNAVEGSLFHRNVERYRSDPASRVRCARPFDAGGRSFLGLIRRCPGKIVSLLKARGYAEKGASALADKIIELDLRDDEDERD